MDSMTCAKAMAAVVPDGERLLDVTILERLSDEDPLWQAVGRKVSPEFRYIVNRVIMPNNGVFVALQ